MVTLFQGSFKIVANKYKCDDTLFKKKQLYMLMITFKVKLWNLQINS